MAQMLRYKARQLVSNHLTTDKKSSAAQAAPFDNGAFLKRMRSKHAR
jgi:hypothetical protein